jgi:hypothetical protein
MSYVSALIILNTTMLITSSIVTTVQACLVSKELAKLARD